MRLLHRLQHHAVPVEPIDAARVVDFLLSPERLDYLHALAKAAHPMLHRHLELPVVVLAAEAEAENRPAVAHVVERRELAGHVARVMHGQHHDRDTEAYPRRDGGGVGQDHAGVEAEDVVERVLGHPKVAEPQRLGALGDPAYRRHVDRIG